MQPRLAIVTGAGSGLGRAFCRRLAQRGGWHVAAVDLDRAGAEQTLAESRPLGLHGGSVEAMDVADAAAWCELRDKLRRDWSRLDLLVNNAGVCMSGEVGDGPVADWQRVCSVNFGGVQLGCHTMTPWLRESARSAQRDDPSRSGSSSPAIRPAVINVASIAASLSAPAMGAYNASKAAVVSLSETLYGELRTTGIDVVVVMPGFFPTRLLANGKFAAREHRLQAEQLSRQSGVTADQVAAAALDAAHRGRLYVVLGRRARWLHRLKRLAPTTLHRLIANKYRRFTKNGGEPLTERQGEAPAEP